MSSSSLAEKWKYNGKELDESLGLDWYDLGARNYDAAIGRFMNIDPKAETYRFQSTYAFAVNNPVVFVDINGERVDHDYGIDQNGKITLIKPTKDATDTLYSVTRKSNGELIKDNKGEVVKNDTGFDGIVDGNDSVTVEKGLLSKVEDKKITDSDGKPQDLQIMDVSSGSFDNIKSIFEFSAKNSNNELSYQSYENGKKFLATTFLPSSELSATTLIGRHGKLLHHFHSHPIDNYLAPSPGDIGSASILIKKFGTRLEIYSPVLGVYKDYNQNSASFELEPVDLGTIKNKKKN